MKVQVVSNGDVANIWVNKALYGQLYMVYDSFWIYRAYRTTKNPHLTSFKCMPEFSDFWLEFEEFYGMGVEL